MNYDGQVMALPGEAAAERSFVSRVYTWMFIGLLITGIVSAVVGTQIAKTPESIKSLGGWMFGGIILELVLVIALSAMIEKLSAGVAATLFVFYSALTGFTISLIFVVYTAESLFSTFIITSGTFGFMATIGHTTKRDLTSVGSFCMMGLFGIIIASIVNIFTHSEGLYWIITYAGILIFVGLTAYDAQKIKQMGQSFTSDTEDARKYAVVAALSIYLDFINLFLFLLRLLGRKR